MTNYQKEFWNKPDNNRRSYRKNMEQRGRGERYPATHTTPYCDPVNTTHIISIHVLFTLLMTCDCERFFKSKNFTCMYEFYFTYYMITKRDVRNILTFVWFVCAHMIWFFWQSKKPAPRTTLGTGKSKDDSESSGDEDVEDDEEVYESIVSDHARLSLYLQWPHNTYNHLWLYFK